MPAPRSLKETLHLVQGCRGQRLEETQAKGLRHRRVDAIEDNVRACALNPGGPASRVKTMARFSEFPARLPFGALELPGQIEIGKCHGTGNGT